MRYMAKKALPLRIDEKLLARVDEARGDVPRTRWVERALEEKLARSGVKIPVGVRNESDEARAPSSPVVAQIGSTPERPPSAPKRGAYVCPVKGCGRAFGVSTAVCPSHGRKVVSLVSQ
jgi:hypothetical protein